MVSSDEKFDAELALTGVKQSESGRRFCFFPLNMFANLVLTLYGRETLRRVQLFPVFHYYSKLGQLNANSRFLVVDNEADKVGVAWRPVVLPHQPDGMARCDVGDEL